jgi:hypothetical protein
MVKIYPGSNVKDENNSAPLDHTKRRGPVKIYLRSILKDKDDHLALFDTNRNGDIDDLVTNVPKGGTVIWKLDRFSGIKRITKIYSKEKEHRIFKSDPIKLVKGEGFKVQLLEIAQDGDEEKYAIECILSNKTKLVIDPYIRIQPPSIPPEKNG